jgi:hypothetical protein
MQKKRDSLTWCMFCIRQRMLHLVYANHTYVKNTAGTYAYVKNSCDSLNLRMFCIRQRMLQWAYAKHTRMLKIQQEHTPVYVEHMFPGG